MLRSCPCQMWRCESTKPGMTIMFDASTSAAVTGRLGPTAAIFDPSIRTSALSKSPSFGSTVRTTPPLIRKRCPGPPPAGGAFAGSADAHAVIAAPASAPVAMPTAVDVLRKSRREIIGTPSSVVRRRQLKEERRHPVLHLREWHRVDDLLSDAIEVLPAEMRLTPEVVELHGAHGLADLLRVEALSLPDGGHEGESGVGEVDARRVPLAEFLRIALLPALQLFW